MTILDHLFILFFAIGVPMMTYKSYPMIKAELQKNSPGIREQLYKSASIQQWIVVSFLLGLYSYNERDLTAMGLSPVSDTAGTWFGFALVIAYVSFSVFILQNARAGGAWNIRLRRWISDMPGAEVGPTNDREMQWFVWVSLTAGICEELIYRGYMMWYFTSMSDPWIALLITSVLFGLNHVYQGVQGVLRTAAAGAVLAYVFLLTDSLLIPMLLHAVVDFYSGKMILHVRQTTSVNQRREL
ncbi:MAG: CPBP family intramembrane metalloprotease [Gammaproteobacteria bacterium]|nr:CPBP family intramembrane metalloprotease [Gammaproteobacteria bacterium]